MCFWRFIISEASFCGFILFLHAMMYLQVHIYCEYDGWLVDVNDLPLLVLMQKLSQ